VGPGKAVPFYTILLRAPLVAFSNAVRHRFPAPQLQRYILGGYLKYFISLLVVLFCIFPLNAFGDDDLYSYLQETKDSFAPFAVWTFERVDYGLHISSKEQIKNSKGKSISAITIDIEGPAPVGKDATIEQYVQSNLKAIIQSYPVNPNFKPKFHVGDGLGATITNINGTNAGLIEYEVPSDRGMIYAKHGLILKDQKLYTFTMIFFDPKADRSRSIIMETLMIAAVNSGKL
jgi:hypothetical protein